jgi:hypothetical protein
VASGGGYSTRRLYCDDEEVNFRAQRPIIVNSIEDIVTRDDMADRCLFLHLPAILPEQRRLESEFLEEIAAARPAILGALFDAAAAGLREQSSVKLSSLPRLADFALWAESVGRGLGWEPGKFLAAYNVNRKEATERSLEDDPVIMALVQLADRQIRWSGTPQDLMSKLAGIAGEAAAKAKSWPRSPQSLTNRIRRKMVALREVGITVKRLKRKNNQRLIEIKRVAPAPPPEAVPEVPAPEVPAEEQQVQMEFPATEQPSTWAPGTGPGAYGCPF